MIVEVCRDDRDGDRLTSFIDDLGCLLVLDADHVLSVHLKVEISVINNNENNDYFKNKLPCFRSLLELLNTKQA